MPDEPKDAFRLPKRLEVTDLEGKPSLPPLPTGAAASVGALSSFDLEDAPLELEPPRVYPQDPPPALDGRGLRRRRPWAWIAGVAVCCALAYAGHRWLQLRDHDVDIELVDAPAHAKLVLDGVPIEARTLRLTRSSEAHRITVFATGRAPKTVVFTALDDATVELGP